MDICIKQNLKRTPFFKYFKEKNAVFAAFDKWDMPIYVSSIKEEHLAVRNNIGIFDVSHMGIIEIKGKDAQNFVNNIITNDVNPVSPNKAIYSPICNEKGGIIDDIVVFKKDAENFIFIVNASNTEKVLNWLMQNKNKYALEIQHNIRSLGLSIQGPKSAYIINKLFGNNITEKLSYYSFIETFLNNYQIILSRTGYTGELGYEIFYKGKEIDKLAQILWDFFVVQEQVILCGLGARDSLRIEVGYPLYGHELNENINPLEAGLSWTVKFDKNNFIGKQALKSRVKSLESRVTKKLVGLEILDKRIPRQGNEIFEGDEKIGEITSGTFSFTLNKPIAVGYIKNLKVKSKKLKVVDVMIRGKRVGAKIVGKSFYYNPNIKI